MIETPLRLRQVHQAAGKLVATGDHQRADPRLDGRKLNRWPVTTDDQESSPQETPPPAK